VGQMPPLPECHWWYLFNYLCCMDEMLILSSYLCWHSACDLLPVLLHGAVQVTSHAQFFVWLEKAIEFYVCYVSQSLADDLGML